MARNAQIKRVLILGSGPIVIGQACEFDYSGTQACKALMQEGIEVILVNSNPATIMTDPDVATRVYVEPLTTQFVAKIIEKEKPDAVIPTLGGQTALNLALDLDREGILKKYNVKMLGANPQIIRSAEDREKFRTILDKVGARYPRSEMVRTYEEAKSAAKKLGLPLILRPNYTLGGGGGGVAYSLEEYEHMIVNALSESPTSEVLVEESILGWKEYELEVMRDHLGTFVVICSIENVDACGVHTGDSITVAPQQTLSDREYQAMRDEAKKIIEEVGLETGGANIQFAVHPETGERLVIEMNPRVSRSSALASKATGFPIAKISALLAIGYSLDEIQNDITRSTPSCYEPSLDYVVTKIPRFSFEKFPGSRDQLTTQMKSVGEVMAIGRTFKESMLKALSSLEYSEDGIRPVVLKDNFLTQANSARIWHVFQALRQGYSVEKLILLTQINPWFLEQFQEIINLENEIKKNPSDRELLLKSKRFGFSDLTLARLLNTSDTEIREIRKQNKILPGYSRVDTCAGEFASSTPYFYSSYWVKSEYEEKEKTIVVLGSGPNRIGQGIEFDYSCVRGVKALRKLGYRVVMVNSNPETVSTDYDTSNELYFEPLVKEHILSLLTVLKPQGVVVQLGGQTPINIASDLVAHGFKILGSDLQSIDLAEDRAQFSKICRELNFKIPNNAMVGNYSQAKIEAEKIGYPIICRPSYVLGGRRMEVIESADELEGYFLRHQEAISNEKPCLMDQFLASALEVDVDLVRGKDWSVIGGILEHIEAAGVHSGDSMGVFPPQRLKAKTCEYIEEMSLKLAERLNTIGHLNLQLAIKNDEIYMLEANPRSSRSVPFLSKASRIPLIDLGIQASLGFLTKDVQPDQYNWRNVKGVSVKGVVFPFRKFPESDAVLGPEMKSTGETMGRGDDYSEALMKAFVSSHVKLPQSGEVFFSLREKDKENLLPLVRALVQDGYKISATSGTADYLQKSGIQCLAVRKVHEGRPNCVDRIRSGDVALVINTTSGRQAHEASYGIRRSCIDFAIPCITESHAAEALKIALDNKRRGDFTVSSLEKMI